MEVLVSPVDCVDFSSFDNDTVARCSPICTDLEFCIIRKKEV